MKVKHFNKKMKKKLLFVFVVLMLMLAATVGHMFYINVAKGDDYGLIVLSQQDETSTVIPYKRGDILDRNGNILATSTKVYNLILDPKVILSKKEYLEPTVDAIVSCFETDRNELINKINEKKDSRYVIWLKKLTFEQIEGFQSLQADTKNNPNIRGVWFEDEYVRNYPYSTLAAATIGYTNSGDSGSWGMEEYYNDVLNGVNGRKYGFVNEDNTMETIIKGARDGNSIISTIDMNIQSIVEKKIQSWVEQYNPANVAVIVAVPDSGEILAMASSKNIFDLNNARDLSRYYTPEQIEAMSDEETFNNLNAMWRNYCISDTYEPGSTVKPFTVAAALEEGMVGKDQTFMCDGVQEVGGWPIHCHKRAGHGVVSLSQSIMYSCNDALMQVAFALGKNNFCDYQSKFGFGLKTGIDLAGEVSAAGLLYTADNMSDSSLATNSFGQNFNATMVQMVAGFSSLINGGNYYRPHVVKQIVNSDGAVVENKGKNVIKQVVTKETSDFLKNSLRETVISGTAGAAAVPGYEIAGKTGTAQINGRRDEDVYILSFMGYAPYDDPEVLCYVLVDEPQVPDPSSSSYASRLFSEIMTEVLPYMDIFPTIDSEIQPQQPETPDDNTQDTSSQPDDQTQSDNQTSSDDQTPPEATAADISDESYEGPLYGQPEEGADIMQPETTAAP